MDWSQFDPEGAARQRFLEIDDMVEQIDDLVRFSDWTKEELVNTLDVSWLHHENGLEGVVYAYPEIQSAISLREVSDTSLMSTCRMLRVQKAAVDFFRELASADGHVTVEMLEKLNGDLLNNEEMAAVYRKDIPIHRTYFHDIAQPEDIKGGLDDLLAWVNSAEARELHIIERAAKAHHWFMHVFPFPKQSGFVGRLFLNYVLERGGYLGAVIHASDRQKYYEALKGSQLDFQNFLCDTLEGSFGNTVQFLTHHSMESLKRA